MSWHGWPVDVCVMEEAATDAATQKELYAVREQMRALAIREKELLTEIAQQALIPPQRIGC